MITKDMNIGVFDPLLFNSLSTLPIDLAINKFRNFDFLERDAILFPICANNHWRLAVFQSNTLEYYDSMGLDGTEYLLPISKIITRARAEKGYPEQSTGIEMRYKIQCPQQSGGHDCGIFVILYSKLVCANIKIETSKMDPMDARNTRVLIKYELLKYSKCLQE